MQCVCSSVQLLVQAGAASSRASRWEDTEDQIRRSGSVPPRTPLQATAGTLGSSRVAQRHTWLPHQKISPVFGFSFTGRAETCCSFSAPQKLPLVAEKSSSSSCSSEKVVPASFISKAQVSVFSLPRLGDERLARRFPLPSCSLSPSLAWRKG